MTHAEKNMTREIGVKHDPAARLWAAVDLVHLDRASDGLKEGGLLLQLQNLYSERADSGDRRTSSGHGTFTVELKKRGYDVRHAHVLIFDYKARRDGRPTTAELRKARREAKAAAKASPFELCEALVKGLCQRLAAYPAAVAECSEDSAKRQALNTAWQEVEPLYLAAAAAHHAVIGAVETIPPKPRHRPIAVVDEQEQLIH
jgi:hypothetical protein